MRHKRPKTRKHGAALLLVVFAIAFITVLALAVLDQATTDLAILRNHTAGLKALYAAHAGVADAIAELRAQYDTTSNVSGTLTAPDGSTCTYEGTIANNKPVVTVTSTGHAEGFTRQVTVRLVVGQPGATAAPYPVRVLLWREDTGWYFGAGS